MSIADAAPHVLHRCIQLGWVPQVVDENASLRLQVALLTGQRDELARELETLTAMAVALRERLTDEECEREAALARLAARRRPSRLAACWAALCGLWFAFWGLFETEASALGEW